MTQNKEVINKNTNILKQEDFSQLLRRVKFKGKNNKIQQAFTAKVDKSSGEILDIGTKMFDIDQRVHHTVFLSMTSCLKTGSLDSVEMTGSDGLPESIVPILSQSIDDYNLYLAKDNT